MLLLHQRGSSGSQEEWRWNHSFPKTLAPAGELHPDGYPPALQWATKIRIDEEWDSRIGPDSLVIR